MVHIAYSVATFGLKHSLCIALLLSKIPHPAHPDIIMSWIYDAGAVPCVPPSTFVSGVFSLSLLSIVLGLSVPVACIRRDSLHIETQKFFNISRPPTFGLLMFPPPCCVHQVSGVLYKTGFNVYRCL